MGDPVQQAIAEIAENPADAGWDDAPNLDVCLMGFIDPVSEQDPLHKKAWREPLDADSRATAYMAKALDLPFSLVEYAAINTRGNVSTRNGELRRVAVKKIQVEGGTRRERTVEMIARVQAMILQKNRFQQPWEIIPLLLTLHGAMAARDQFGALSTTKDGISIREYTRKMTFYEPDPGPQKWRLNPLWRADRPLWGGRPITIRHMLDCAASDGYWFTSAALLTGGVPESCWEAGKTLQLPQNGRKMALFWYFIAERMGAEIASVLHIERISLKKKRGKRKRN